MNIPRVVEELMNRLREAGYTAYAVGGCVRDTLLGLTPHDWDLCTSALPEQMREVFRGERTVETGMKHGTLTVIRDHVPYEITTFRVDGAYTDHRHPDAVAFVDDVREDLARRDFTVNAMAYAPETGLLDPFGGQEDLQRKLIRCVGVAEHRFGEDALRILRALRFASVYDFAIEEETDTAVRKMAGDLSRVAAERIREELMKLLCGPGAGRILREYPLVFAVIIPEIAPAVGYDQRNHHHSWDLWEHTVLATENIPPEPDLRLTMLLHDLGKPRACVIDEKGEAHYKKHQAYSGEIAARVCEDLRLDHETRDRVVRLVVNHDIPLRNERGEIDTEPGFLLRKLNQFGEKDLLALFQIHRADRIATGYSSPEREQARYEARIAALDALLAKQPCFTLKDLAVNGNDLIALGLKGKKIGETLQWLLEQVMDGKAENRKDALIDLIQGTTEEKYKENEITRTENEAC